MHKNPLVSVLMTSFNREKYIAEAIESVLNSTYQNLELIIVDDKSIDRTVEIAQSYAAKDARVKVYVNEQNIGDYPNRNKAASYAEGKYLKYVDSDDVIYPHGLEVMVRCIEQYDNVAYGACSSYSLKKLPVNMSPRESYLEHFFGNQHFNRAPGSLIINREIFLKEGGFSGKRMVGDYEFLLNYSMKYNIVLMPMHLYWPRKHEGQESAVSSEFAVMRLRVLNLALSNPLCPLSAEEKKLIELNRSKTRIWAKIMSLLKKFV